MQSDVSYIYTFFICQHSDIDSAVSTTCVGNRHLAEICQSIYMLIASLWMNYVYLHFQLSNDPSNVLQTGSNDLICDSLYLIAPLMIKIYSMLLLIMYRVICFHIIKLFFRNECVIYSLTQLRLCNCINTTAEASFCALSCGGDGLRISLCPDRRVNTDQNLPPNRLACYHV